MTSSRPALDWLPAESESDTPDWAFTLRNLKPDTPELFYFTSQMKSCWRYFTKENVPKLSAEFPKDYESDIGTAYKSDELAKPNTIWYCRAWHVGGKRMVVLTIDSFPVMKTLKKLLKNDELRIIELEGAADPSLGVMNFYVTLTRDSAPITSAMTYVAETHVRPTKSEQLLAEAAKPWYPENYVKNISPLEPAPTAPASTGVAAPEPGPTTTPPEEEAW